MGQASTAVSNFVGNIALHFERSNVERFQRWSKFLGRKMFLGLMGLVIYTGLYASLLLVFAFTSGAAEALKAFVDTFTEFSFGFVTILGGVAGFNVLEHREQAKVKIAQAAPGATPAPAPAPTDIKKEA